MLKKIRLIKAQKILHESGDIVEVSPDVYDFLITAQVGVPVEDGATNETPEQPRPKRTGKK